VSPAQVSLEFGCIDITPRNFRLDDPEAADLLARLRAIPGYRRELETGGTGIELLYTRERCGAVKTPLLPARPPSPFR
jgi:hypothetical protein